MFVLLMNVTVIVCLFVVLCRYGRLQQSCQVNTSAFSSLYYSWL